MENNLTHQDLLNELHSLQKEAFEFLKEQTISLESKVIKTSNKEIEKDFIPVNLTEFKSKIYDLFLKNDDLIYNFNEFCISINDILKNYFDVFFIFLPNNFLKEPLVISNLSSTPDTETTISLISTYHKYILDNFNSINANPDIYNSIIKERKIKNFSLFPFFTSDNKLLGFLLLETYHKVKLSDTLEKVFSDLINIISQIIENKLLINTFKNTNNVLSKTNSILITLNIDNYNVLDISDNIYSYGYFKFDVINHSWLDFIFFEDRDYFTENLQENLKNNNSHFSISYRIQTSYFTFEYVSHDFILTTNLDGSLQLDGVIQNISKLKEYELSLENYNTILNIYNNALNDINKINNNSTFSIFQKITAYLEILTKYFDFNTAILARIANNNYNIYSIVSNEYNFDNTTSFELTETLCEITLKNNDFTLYSDIDNYAELQNHPVYLTFQPKSYAGLPIIVDTKLWGTLSLINKSNSFNPDFSAILRDIMNTIANNISNLLYLKQQSETWNKNETLTNSKELIIEAFVKTYFDGIILTDNNNLIIQINQKVCDIFDFPLPSKVLIKKPFNLFINHIRELFNNPSEFDSFYNNITQSENLISEVELDTIDNHKIFIRTNKVLNGSQLIGILWNIRKTEVINDSITSSIISNEIKEIWKKENLDAITVNDLPDLKKELKDLFGKFTDLMLDFAENFFMNDYDAASKVTQDIIQLAINSNLIEVVKEAKILLDEALPTRNFNKISDQYEKVNNSIKKFKELTKFIWYDEEEEAT
ncbi:MAG TPA: GAF domain-containing protein [Ignavibacteriales bacterium]|nr:GAF domain-containing protein [Ignavibacteriales bacterium]HPD67192.1 GAF domain-containing protein [Ignavibacteriales bacterium]HRR18730.1 GAF domain-containing protein [Ignavibacteriales bacterium]HRT98449.1 GAF domain-containing protein [Ignavibacteriales bacterium]